jgi:hypothetical protein
MSKKTKTVKVSTILERANKYLANDNPRIGDAERLAVASFLEGILLDTGNYEGFNYLEWLNGGCERWRADGEPANNTAYLGNQTKRVYYSNARTREETAPEEQAMHFPKGLEFRQ